MAISERDFSDRHRPRYHLTAPSGWLNDPNGMIDVDGEYHLFYQYNPEAPRHDRIHWGHVTSTDLVTWIDKPIALAPDTAADRDGCWSGVIVQNNGVPTAIYSGRQGEVEVPCIAVGNPDLTVWTKYEGNPVIAGPPADLDAIAFRDHSVWKEGDTWLQVVGAGVRGVGGAALLYKSEDLISWRYCGPFLAGSSAGDPHQPDWLATMWECIDYFPLDDEPDGSILAFSAWDEGRTLHSLYWTGARDGDQFEPHSVHRLDLGGRTFYAPQSMTDRHGRRVMFGWLQERRSELEIQEVGWCGVMSLPRVVSRGSHGIRLDPAAEVALLRNGLLGSDVDVLEDGAHIRWMEGFDQVDVEFEVDVPRDGGFELTLLASDTSSERTIINVVRSTESEVLVTTDCPSPAGETGFGGVVPAIGDAVSVRILIDHSVIECFVNGVAMSLRSYPVARDANRFHAQGIGPARIQRFEAWRMKDAFREA